MENNTPRSTVASPPKQFASYHQTRKPTGKFERASAALAHAPVASDSSVHSIAGNTGPHELTMADHAFDDSGTKPGMEIWRIEHFGVKKKKNIPSPSDTPRNVGMLAHVGTFYAGDSYIILNTEVSDACAT